MKDHFVWNRGDKFPLSKNFLSTEFECKCGGCTRQFISKDLVDKLQALRIYFGMPVKINSAYRCPDHNATVGGSQLSQHLLGRAADIVIIDVPVNLVARKADAIFNGLGRYTKFTHVDVRPNGAARWTGGY